MPKALSLIGLIGKVEEVILSGSKHVEEMRRRYAYRRLVLEGKVSLPAAAAARLIGPDCAYHLYRRLDGEDRGEGDRQ